MAKSARIEIIARNKIRKSKRLRDLDLDYAQVLAASIGDSGLKHPIIVRPIKDDEFEFELVAGLHRDGAHELLGLATIKASIEELTDDQARLIEIDENLCRRDLGALDRAIHLAERKAVWERLHPETKHGGDRKSLAKQGENQVATMATWSDRFTKEVQAKTGISERTIQRSVALIEGLSSEAIRLLRLTPLADNAAQIRQLAAEEKADQIKLLKAIAKGDAKSLKQARIACGIAGASEVSVHEKAFQALMRAWERATPRARRQFQTEVDLAPVAHKPVVERAA